MNELWFEQLVKDREENAKILQKPSMRGVERSVVDKYSDQAHFVYELLQNADDVGADSVDFLLQNHQLIFLHNGKRHFTISNPATEIEDGENGVLGDLNAITSIAQSNKDAKIAIGKFGVGFKAVFQYTKSPEIYDPQVCFRIEDFIVPRKIDRNISLTQNNKTVFVFPFNHDRISPEQSYQDIQEKLQNLIFPCLFLTNLKSIIFQSNHNSGHYKKHILETRNFSFDTTAECILLEKKLGTKVDKNTLWLFTRISAEGYKYSVGFFVDKNGLVPVHYNAFCFFSTQKATNLSFIFHAPFALTDSREGIIATDKHNIALVQAIASLAADSFEYLKEIDIDQSKNYLSDNIYEIIPYDKSKFSDLSDKNTLSLMPIYEKIKEKFSNSALLPYGGGYTKAQNALWAFVPDYTELFSDTQVSLIFKNNFNWVFRSFGKQETARNNKVLSDYITDLGCKVVTDKEIYEKLEFEFLKQQSIEWFCIFYEWLTKTEDRKSFARKSKIFLDKNNIFVSAYDNLGNLNLFLADENIEGFVTIHPEIEKNKHAAGLLEYLKITKPNVKDEIYLKILPQYENNTNLDDSRFFCKIFEYYKIVSEDEKRNLLAKLRKYQFLKCVVNSTEQIVFENPLQIYFPNENLKKYFSVIADIRFLLFDYYVQLVSDKELLKKFFQEVGVSDNVRIVEQYYSAEEANRFGLPNNHSTREKKWIDYLLYGYERVLSEIITNKNFELSVVLWNELIQKYDELKNIQGRYEYFYWSSLKEFFEPIFLRRLKKNNWLLDINKQFSAPAQLSDKTLFSGYYQSHYSSEQMQALFDYLGIKVEKEFDTTSLPLEIQKKLDFADSVLKLGITEDNLERVKQFVGLLNVHFDSSDNGSISFKSFEKQTENIIESDEYNPVSFDNENCLAELSNELQYKLHNVKLLEKYKSEAESSEIYSFNWFKSLLRLENFDKADENYNNKNVYISFGSVEREEGTKRTIILKSPHGSISPQLEDLTDIPLTLFFNDTDKNRILLEAVSVKGYIVTAVVKNSINLDEIDFLQINRAEINVHAPWFIMEKLADAFCSLPFVDTDSLQEKLPYNLQFIFGPPGTGKTTFLAKNIANVYWPKDKRIKILVLTPTNKAADVLTQKLIDTASFSEDELIRFGTTSNEQFLESAVFKEKSFNIIQQQKAVVVTTIARFVYDYFFIDSSKAYLKDLNWDYIIFDESSMIPLVNILYVIYKTSPKLFVIAGDPLQIGPIMKNSLWKDENIYTICKLNSFKKPSTYPYDYVVIPLMEQYRSISAVGEIFSKFSYGGILTHVRNNEDSRVQSINWGIDIKPVTVIKFPVSKRENIYRSTRLDEKTPYQIYTAIFTYEFTAYLIKKIEQTSKIITIGIISPYRAQAELINKLVSGIVTTKQINVQVGTIHGFQGDECDIIITVFNPPVSLKNSSQIFINKHNIINVSISRAKDSLILLLPDDDTEDKEYLDNIVQLEKIIKQGEYIEYKSKELERILFNSPTYIEDNTFCTTHQFVNVYREPEKLYEVRCEKKAIDIQVGKH